jgi:hypothetical protein
MPPTHQLLHDSQLIDNQLSQSENRSTKFKRLVSLTCLLGFIGLVLTSPQFFPGHDNQTVSAAQGPQKSSANLSDQDATSCLENTDWPPAFEVEFTAYFAPPTKYGPWAHNVLQYQYDAATQTPQFKSTFPKCVNLPGVPLTFFGRSCEFYFSQDPQNGNQWNAYVYSSNQYFLLASNLGPPAPNLVSRYNHLLPIRCFKGPRPGSGVPVGNPPGVAVEWFLTSGTSGALPKSPKGQGYYAAIAKPAGPGNQYKPIYSFVGETPGFHGRLVYGQLIYDWQNLNFSPTFSATTFTPPTTGYTKIAGTVQLPPPPPVTCPACHVSDPNVSQTFFTQIRRQNLIKKLSKP